MHPAAMWWWKRRSGGGEGCSVSAGCGPSPLRGGSAARAWAGGDSWSANADEGHGGFGVRRPLRFLAWKLELDDAQVREVARILDELKTERAQAAVDQRRTGSAFADAIASESFDAAAVAAAADQRVDTARRTKDAVVKALSKMHAVLRPDQRETLSTLMRTGTVTI